jgi:hypothetical protein
MNEYHSQEGSVKAWLEDNLRVLVSVLIVVAIAGGIYSYSKRSQSDFEATDMRQEEPKDSLFDKIVGKDGNDREDAAKKDASPDVSTQDAKRIASTSTESSKETETAFVEFAQRGDGMTHLARRAIADYLEKNPDSSLTVEHKVYVEDYLRKHSVRPKNYTVGSSVEFSKDLIKQSLEQSKTLNEKQLKNLQKYSKRVPSLR